MTLPTPCGHVEHVSTGSTGSLFLHSRAELVRLEPLSQQAMRARRETSCSGQRRAGQLAITAHYRDTETRSTAR